MNHAKIFLLFAVGILAVSACAPAGIPLPAPAATATPFVGATAAIAPSEPAATSTPDATQTVAPTLTPAASSSAITMRTPVAGSSAVTPPGVYATKIRLIPPEPKSGPDYVTFYATFQNTTGKTLQYKWFVKIYAPDNSLHSFGETAVLVSDILPGTNEIASIANWRTNPISCMPLTARVFWVNTDVSVEPVEFKKPDGTAGPAINFQVCPGAPWS